MGRILITGGAGYIGSHAVYALVDANKEVIVIDNLETGFLQAIHPNAVFYKGDIRDTQFLLDVFSREKIEAVIHFAANSLVGESMTNPLKYYDNNVGGTCSLLKAMSAHKISSIVFSSTAAVYGEPEQTPISESSPTNPTNPYGETKLAMERMFAWAEKAYGIRFVSLRYFNACGARGGGEIGESHNPETHLIPLVLQVPNGKRDSISIYGDNYDTKDGTCVRDYIHVEDLIQAHILAMDYLLNGGKSDIFNLGNGVGFTVKEVIQAAERAVGSTIAATTVQRREGDPARLVASNEKACQILGWKPQQSDILSMVSSAWEWHHNHPNGFC